MMEEVDGPEVALWRAVVSKAIDDATAIVRPRQVRGTGKMSAEDRRKANQKKMERAIRERNQARSWLLGDSKDFRNVCTMALLDSDAVRERAEALALRNWEVQRPKRIAESLADGEDDELKKNGLFI